MKILLVNKFLFLKGGDATAMLTTADLLRSRGHDVFCWGMAHPSNSQGPLSDLNVRNVDYNRPRSLWRELRWSNNILYSWEAYNRFDRVLKRIKPDLIHLHNFAHQISPSILQAAARHRIPAVMTMHDYKLVCPVYTLMHDNRPCQLCSGGRFYHCFAHSCSKGSRLKSLLGTLEMTLHHQVLDIYRHVDTFIAPSRFMQSKVIEMGFKGRVRHLPCFIDVHDIRPAGIHGGKSVIYIGRLSQEKGIETLIDAVANTGIELKIAGDGPIKEALVSRVARLQAGNIEFLGFLSRPDLVAAVNRSLCVILPSIWYENLPFAMIECLALGKPAIGADIGGIPELVQHGKTGLLFQPGNVQELRNKILALAADPAETERMGRNARTFVETELNQEKHYRELMEIYDQAIQRNSR